MSEELKTLQEKIKQLEADLEKAYKGKGTSTHKIDVLEANINDLNAKINALLKKNDEEEEKSIWD